MQDTQNFPLAWYKAWRVTKLGKTLISIDIRFPGGIVLPLYLLKTIPYLQEIDSSTGGYALNPELAKLMSEQGLIELELKSEIERAINTVECSGLEDEEEERNTPGGTPELDKAISNYNKEKEEDKKFREIGEI